MQPCWDRNSLRPLVLSAAFGLESGVGLETDPGVPTPIVPGKGQAPACRRLGADAHTSGTSPAQRSPIPTPLPPGLARLPGGTPTQPSPATYQSCLMSLQGKGGYPKRLSGQLSRRLGSSCREGHCAIRRARGAPTTPSCIPSQGPHPEFEAGPKPGPRPGGTVPNWSHIVLWWPLYVAVFSLLGALGVRV